MATFQTKSGKPVAYAYEYEITSSTVHEVPVGTFIYDSGRENPRSWHVYDSGTHEVLHFSGPRRRRICGECAAYGFTLTPWGHDGPHGEGAPRLTPPTEG